MENNGSSPRKARDLKNERELGAHFSNLPPNTSPLGTQFLICHLSTWSKFINIAFIQSINIYESLLRVKHSPFLWKQILINFFSNKCKIATMKENYADYAMGI